MVCLDIFTGDPRIFSSRIKRASQKDLLDPESKSVSLNGFIFGEYLDWNNI